MTTNLSRQITSGPTNTILTNANVWSPDGEWIYYDVRSDAAGSNFDGNRIERVHVETGKVETVYQSSRSACVGVVTACPKSDRVVFIHGPHDPTPEWNYNAWHRRGVIARADLSKQITNVDARDITPPFTVGALRGGSHVHTFSPDGQWIAFTYEDHVLAELGNEGPHERNTRQIGVSIPVELLSMKSLRVNPNHRRNHDGNFFSVLVSFTHDEPLPGSDEIFRACEDAWIGRQGYLRSDGSRQHRAIAFQGEVVAADGEHFCEVFVLDLPDDLTRVGRGPLEGTPTTRPRPPRGVVQRRLTFTSERKFPGIQGPRHWLRSTPDGERIAFLMRDDAGIVQLWTVSPRSGDTTQLTHNANDIASAFTWSNDGKWIAHAMDTSVCVTDSSTGKTFRVTPPGAAAGAPRPEACVFSPDGTRIAYVASVADESATGNAFTRNQIFVCTLGTHTSAD